jgi:hypothetical protein
MSQPDTQLNDLDVFARVTDGKVVEYPVYRIHIRNRAHPLSYYHRVVDAGAPTPDEFGTVDQTLEVHPDNTVHVVYTKRPLTLSEILRTFKVQNIKDPMASVEAKPISEIDPATIQHVYSLAGDYISVKLDEFARTKQYNDFIHLTGYRYSAIPSFAAEAMRGYTLRDQIWANLLVYFTEVTSGAVPVPTSIADIDAVIPNLTWDV